MRRRALLMGGKKRIPAIIKVFNVTSAQFRFRTTSGNYTVDWGDGNKTSHNSSSVATHSYSSPYTGEILVYVRGGLEKVTEITALSATGSVSYGFDLDEMFITQFPNLDNFNINMSYGRFTGEWIFPPTMTNISYVTSGGVQQAMFNIANLPPSLENCTIYQTGLATNVYGDVQYLPPSLTLFRPYGLNVISGDVADLPSGLTNVHIAGSNTISGDVADLPSGLTSVQITGSNTISGDLSTPNNIRRLELSVNSTAVGTASGEMSYTINKIWSNNMQAVIVRPATGGLTADGNQVANMIIDLSGSTWDSGSSTFRVVIRGNAIAPTPSPELTAAISNLNSKGIQVYTN